MASEPVLTFFRHNGGSGEIRGKQIAEYLGAQLNPDSGYEKDTCVYVKMQPPDNYPVKSYLDIVDGQERMSWLKKHPQIGIIASSLTGLEYIAKVLHRQAVYIPHHHCNYERAAHNPTGTWQVGVVGGNGAITNYNVKDRLDVLHVMGYRNRQDVIDRYEQIDIQVIWRISASPLKNPLKIINAASFGIPTVALYCPEYQEMDGYYWPVYTVDEMVTTVEMLKDGFDAARLMEKAEQYHIEHVAKLYQELL